MGPEVNERRGIGSERGSVTVDVQGPAGCGVWIVLEPDAESGEKGREDEVEEKVVCQPRVYSGGSRSYMGLFSAFPEREMMAQ